MLVIDDCEEFRKSLANLLREIGYSVMEADGPEEAKYISEQNDVDLVFCDLAMPLDADEEDSSPIQANSVMVGVNAMKELSERQPDVPIVAISGEICGNSLRGLSKFGARAVLTKPISLSDLRSAIDDALGSWST